MKTYGYAAVEQGTPLVPFTFERRESNGDDVTIEILYSGVCHSDLHMAKTTGDARSTRWFPVMKLLAK